MSWERALAMRFTLALMQSGIERDTLVYDLTDAEIEALLRPIIDAAADEVCDIVTTLGGIQP